MNDDLQNLGFTEQEQAASKVSVFAGIVMTFFRGLIDDGATEEQALSLTRAWIQASTKAGAAND